MRMRSDVRAVFRHELDDCNSQEAQSKNGLYNRLARQSFVMLKILKNRVLFELCLWKKKEKDERRKKGRKKERKKTNNI